MWVEGDLLPFQFSFFCLSFAFHHCCWFCCFQGLCPSPMCWSDSCFVGTLW